MSESQKAEGLDYPYGEFVSGFDTNIHVAVLSRFPIQTRRPHSRESFLLNGRRFFTSRGFAEVEIRVNPSYSFTLINAHLKSKRAVGVADDQPNPNPAFPPRHITWTHYYAKEDVYSRIDYLLVSQGMVKEWDPTGTYVLTLPNWAVGSDHRPIIARFQARDR